MKTIVLFFVFNLLFLGANAQISVGFRAGAGASQVYFNPTRTENFLVGYTAGVVAKYLPTVSKDSPLGLNAGLQMELNFSHKGWRETKDSFPDYFQRTLNYVEFAAMSHIVLGRKNLQFVINLGPQIGYCLGSSVDKSVRPELENYFADSTVNKISFELTGGIGLCYHSKVGDFQLETRYTHGFSDIVKMSTDGQPQWAQSQFLSVCFSYLIPFKRKEEIKK